MKRNLHERLVAIAVFVTMVAKPVDVEAAMLRSPMSASHLPAQFMAPTLVRESEVPEEIIAPCKERPGSHICDPEHLLSGGAFDLQSEALRRLAEVKKVSQCPGMGYEVYLAILSVPPQHAHAAATALGRRWGVLGSTEACGAVAVYAARERTLAVVADRAMEDTVLPPKVEQALRRSPFQLAEPASADAVVESMVGQLSSVLDGSDSKHYALVQQGIAIFLYGISSIIGLVATALLVFCLYDITAHWFHVMRFHRCQNKVERVHEALLSHQGELNLCPYCVTSVKNQPCSSHVVFLCGHRFHMECANRWFAEDPRHSGRCAICACGSQEARELRPLPLEATEAQPCWQPECLKDGKANVELKELGDEDGKRAMNEWDEAKNFMLSRLHNEYPDIIRSDLLERWSSCHTEIWLSELRCPRYKSIFAKHNAK